MAGARARGWSTCFYRTGFRKADIFLAAAATKCIAFISASIATCTRCVRPLGLGVTVYVVYEIYPPRLRCVASRGVRDRPRCRRPWLRWLLLMPILRRRWILMENGKVSIATVCGSTVCLVLWRRSGLHPHYMLLLLLKSFQARCIKLRAPKRRVLCFTRNKGVWVRQGAVRKGDVIRAWLDSLRLLFQCTRGGRWFGLSRRESGDEVTVYTSRKDNHFRQMSDKRTVSPTMLGGGNTQEAYAC